MSSLTPDTPRTDDKPHWLDTLKVYAEPASLRMLSLGFSAGLPLLLVFGTLVALNAYLWLLQKTTAAVAGSYSFVNPAVALVVGVVIGKEVLIGWVFLALPLIAGALAMIMYGPAIVGWVRSRTARP